jgi:uncharacterized coiled-coil protein SlyX
MDRKQSAVARRLAEQKSALSLAVQEPQLTFLQTQVGKHENTLISLNSYTVYLNQNITKAQDNITDLFTRLGKVETYTTVQQGRLVGRWSSAGTGTLQEVTIGYGLKLSNGGELSALTAQIADASIIITAGNGLLGGGDLTQNRSLSVNFAANGEVSSSKAVRADDSRLSGLAPSTGLFDIDGGDAGVYTGTPILDGGGA